jgi:hypothetical protein
MAKSDDPRRADKLFRTGDQLHNFNELRKAYEEGRLTDIDYETQASKGSGPPFRRTESIPKPPLGWNPFAPHGRAGDDCVLLNCSVDATGIDYLRVQAKRDGTSVWFDSPVTVIPRLLDATAVEVDAAIESVYDKHPDDPPNLAKLPDLVKEELKKAGRKASWDEVQHRGELPKFKHRRNPRGPRRKK